RRARSSRAARASRGRGASRRGPGSARRRPRVAAPHARGDARGAQSDRAAPPRRGELSGRSGTGRKLTMIDSSSDAATPGEIEVLGRQVFCDDELGLAWSAVDDLPPAPVLARVNGRNEVVLRTLS